MRKFNVNHIIKVKLNDLGKEIYYHQFDDLNDMCKKVIIEPRYPEVDSDGFTEFQLWELMSIYGLHLKMHCQTPFEDCSIYIRDKDLEEVKC